VKENAGRVSDFALRIEDAILLILTSAIVVIVFAGVVIRYTPLTAKMVWTGELSRFCFLWLVFGAAASIERLDGHYKADIVPNLLRGRVRTFLHCVIKSVTLAAFVVLTWSAYSYNVSQIGADTQQLRWPAITRSLPLLLCSVLSAAYVAIDLMRSGRRLRR
jgi:TRAP-type C4-dicarboxylate transport system permease small subunit